MIAHDRLLVHPIVVEHAHTRLGRLQLALDDRFRAPVYLLGDATLLRWKLTGLVGRVSETLPLACVRVYVVGVRCWTVRHSSLFGRAKRCRRTRRVSARTGKRVEFGLGELVVQHPIHKVLARLRMLTLDRSHITLLCGHFYLLYYALADFVGSSQLWRP